MLICMSSLRSLNEPKVRSDCVFQVRKPLLVRGQVHGELQLVGLQLTERVEHDQKISSSHAVTGRCTLQSLPSDGDQLVVKGHHFLLGAYLRVGLRDLRGDLAPQPAFGFALSLRLSSRGGDAWVVLAPGEDGEIYLHAGKDEVADSLHPKGMHLGGEDAQVGDFFRPRQSCAAVRALNRRCRRAKLRSLAQGALLELLRQGKGWQDARRRRWPSELPRGSTQECPQARSRGNRLLTGNLARGLGLDDRALYLQRFHLLRGAGADSRQRCVQERLKRLLNFVIHLRGPLGQVEVEVRLGD